MSRILMRLAAAGLALLLGACAHPISITPDTASLTDSRVQVKKSVAYVISDADRAQEVTTPGGGGDSVRYYPYRELESGIFQALSAVYSRVTLWRSGSERQAPASKDVALVFVPKVTTGSSSSSIVTWPPTSFFVTIAYEVQDAAGRTVYTNQVLGRGAAEYEEFKGDFGLAGKRATGDVLRNFKAQVEGAAELK
ncbi:MAG: hypothetical protein JSS40_15980 [Proteobacteria bacterium]|nr:hypothetical protein [Pseudomonadota bacterium]